MVGILFAQGDLWRGIAMFLLGLFVISGVDNIIQIRDFGLTDINDLTIIDDGGGNAQIFLPSGDSVTLTGIDHTTLVDGDFDF